MQYSKYENFSTNSASSETNNAMKKLDEAGKTDDGRKEEFKIIGGMDIDSDSERYGQEPINDLSFDDSIYRYKNRIDNATSPQELSGIINEMQQSVQLYENSLTESQRIYDTLPSGPLKNTIFTSILDTNNNINTLNNYIRQANLRISILPKNKKRKYSVMEKGMGGKKKSKSQKKRKNKRKTKKTSGVNYTYTLYMLPNKEIVEIIEYDDKYKKNIKNNYNNIDDMKDYYTTLKKIDNIPCNKNELHPNKLIKK